MELKPFDQAKRFVHSLNLKTVKQWKEYTKENKLPIGIPTNPNREFQNEWQSWGDWLGTGAIAAKDKQFMSYEYCKQFISNLNLDGKDKYISWQSANTNSGCPSRPDYIYKDEWVSWGEFLGTGRIADQYKHQNFLSYEKAKAYLAPLSFKNEDDFFEWAKTDERPNFIPASPRKTYVNTFISMGDFLSSGTYRTKDFLSYEECRDLVQTKQFNCQEEFKEWIKIHKNDYLIPTRPDQAIHDG